MDLFIPKNEDIGKITHLAVSAHQDDIEFMAYHGILECFMKEDKRFGAVVVTNGSGSPRSGIYADCSDETMMKIRKDEQKKAAIIGDYAMQAFLDAPSAKVKDKFDRSIIDELKEIIIKTQPKYIYTHNLADKHDTHIAVAMRLITALRELKYVPDAIYGCEVWRALDWICDDEKISLDVAGRGNLEAALLGVFDSQIAGGKRYDNAVIGRRMANATFAQSHGVDSTTSVIYAMDLLPLLKDSELDIAGYVTAYIDRFKADVADKINKF